MLHIGEPFGVAFAEWLDGQTPHRVAYARDGEPLSDVGAGASSWRRPTGTSSSGTAADSDSRDPERHSCRPSVDVLFESVALEFGAASVACLLTGMGSDGAAGLLAIRRAGGFTIAQDEATSVVYGMPREAVRLGAAEAVLPLGEIGRALAALVGARPESSP